MITIFALYLRFEEARGVVRDLLGRGFSLEAMNVIVPDYIAKSAMGVKPERGNIEVEAMDPSLDKMLAGEQIVTITDVGGVYAAGELATQVAKTASVPGAAGFGLGPALVGFTLDEETARAYVEGINKGGVLFWIRVADGRASEAVILMKEHKGRKMASR